MILSRLFGMAQVDLMPFAGKPTEAVMGTRPNPACLVPVHVATAGTAPAFDAFGLGWRVLAGSADTAGTYNLFEVTMPASGAFGPWVHAQDQALYGLDGALQVLLDGAATDAAAGSFTFVPAGTVIALRAGPGGGRLLMFHLPGGFDQAVTRAGTEGEAGLRTCLDALGSRRVALPAG